MHSSPTSLLRDHGRHPNLGVLSSPRRAYPDVEGWPWAADNDAYMAWDETRFLRMLDRIRPIDGCLFVVAPDVVADADRTLERFWQWLPRLEGFPAALAAQDGLVDPPWDDFDCLFIGGSTGWKLGPDAALLAAEAKRRGKWLHMGRVNTRRRMVYAKSIGCDSVDGTNFSMYRQTNLPWALRIASGPTQLALAARGSDA